jgi:hypothetical protein
LLIFAASAAFTEILEDFKEDDQPVSDMLRAAGRLIKHDGCEIGNGS